LAARNEAQLEAKFIAPLRAQLGWAKAYQVGITVQSKFVKPNYCLVLYAAQEEALIATKDHLLITAICESKAWDSLLAQNDHLVVRLYGITPAELAHLLQSFKVMAHKRPEYMALLVSMQPQVDYFFTKLKVER
jgi:hypothetical protein